MTFEAMEQDYYKAFYDNKAIGRAIDLAEEAFQTFPEHREQIYLDLMIFYYANGQHDLCKKYFAESLEQGYWYPQAYLRDLLDDQAYEALWALWSKLRKSRHKAKVFVVKPKNYSPMRAMPLMVSLHGWGEDYALFSRFWQSPALTQDYIHVFIESSQQIGYKHFCWDDREQAFKDVEGEIQKLKGQYAIGQIFFSGFSQGGHLAVDLAMNSKLPGVGGFIALNPSISDFQMIRQDFKGYIITGDQDHDFESQKTFVEGLRSRNMICHLEVIPSWGHWFPEDLSQRLDRAIQTIG